MLVGVTLVTHASWVIFAYPCSALVAMAMEDRHIMNIQCFKIPQGSKSKN